jgi:hypothetical protein
MNIIQAVVKTTYTNNPKAAKASVRYFAHRIDREGNRITRQLFGNYGLLAKEDAYRMIDAAKGRNYFYRIIISPENSTGAARDLSGITRQTMRDLQKILRTKRPIPLWPLCTPTIATRRTCTPWQSSKPIWAKRSLQNFDKPQRQQ